VTEPGLCARCSHARTQGNKRGSVFWRCAVHDDDPQWPKYPRLPVARCARFTALPIDPPPQ
jgi:hypothetical protein